VREKGKRFLQRLSNAVKKVAQLPKIKKHWELLCWLRQEAPGRTIDELADHAREQWRSSPRKSVAESILADKRAVIVRFIKTNKHFIGVS